MVNGRCQVRSRLDPDLIKDLAEDRNRVPRSVQHVEELEPTGWLESNLSS